MKTKKEFEEMLETILSSKELAAERQFIAYTKCKTYGTVNIIKIRCNDPECTPCSSFNKALIEETKKGKTK